MRAARTAAGLVAGALALTLVAAETAPTTGAGTASTRMLGAQVRVTGPLQTPVTRVLDITSTATTQGTPQASTSVVPLAVGETQVGATGASSDGQTSSSTDGGSVGDLGGALGVVVQPIETSASATADRAVATVGAALGEVGALLGQIGLELDTTGVSSLATRTGSAATQGLQVSGLTLSLGDLGLGADVLGQLDLASLLDLLASLPGLLPTDLAEVTDLQGLLDELDEALASLGPAAAPLQDTLADLTAIVTVLPDVQALDDVLTDLTSLSTDDLVTLLADLTSLAGAADAVGCTLDGLADLTPDALAILTDAIDCVEGELTAIGDDLATQGISGISGDPAALLGELTAIVDTLTAALPDQLDPVLAVLDAVTALLEQVLAGVADLDDLLALLPDLLAGAAGTELLGVGAFDVGATAVAGPTTDDSSAAVLCQAVDVSVLGQSFQTPDCSDALAQLPDVTGAIADAVNQVTGVLNTLPLADLVEVGELRADLFTDVVEQVTETDGVVTSTAGLTLLDLEVPTVTLDPSQVTDALGGLGLPDVLGPVETVLGELQAGLDTLDTLGVAAATDLLTTVNDTLTEVGAPDGLTGTVDQVTLLIDGLELADLGTLTEGISTPGLELVIDPVSTATFVAAADGGTAAPAPTPTSTPTLPSTGGGLALLGVLALAGAGALRRRS